jgi:hypothetical protein
VDAEDAAAIAGQLERITIHAGIVPVIGRCEDVAGSPVD